MADTSTTVPIEEPDLPDASVLKISVRKAESELALERAQIAKLSEQLEKAHSELKDSQNRVTELTRLNAAIVKEHDELSRFDRTSAEVNEVEEKLKAALTRAQTAEDECRVLKSERTAVDKVRDDLVKDFAAAKTEHAALNREIEKLRLEARDLRSKVEDLQPKASRLDTVQKELDDLTAEMKSARADLKEQASKLHSAEREVRTLKFLLPQHGSNLQREMSRVLAGVDSSPASSLLGDFRKHSISDLDSTSSVSEARRESTGEVALGSINEMARASVGEAAHEEDPNMDEETVVASVIERAQPSSTAIPSSAEMGEGTATSLTAPAQPSPFDSRTSSNTGEEVTAVITIGPEQNPPAGTHNRPSLARLISSMFLGVLAASTSAAEGAARWHRWNKRHKRVNSSGDLVTISVAEGHIQNARAKVGMPIFWAVCTSLLGFALYVSFVELANLLREEQIDLDLRGPREGYMVEW